MFDLLTIDTFSTVFGMFDGLSDSAILFGGIFDAPMKFLQEHRAAIATVVGVVTCVAVAVACTAAGAVIGSAIGGPAGATTGAMYGARVGIALGLAAGAYAGYLTYNALEQSSSINNGPEIAKPLEQERLDKKIAEERQNEEAAKKEQERLERKLKEVEEEEAKEKLKRLKEEERKKEEAARKEKERLEKEKAEILRVKESKLILIRDTNADGTAFNVLDFCDVIQKGNTITIQGKNLDEVNRKLEKCIDKFFDDESQRNPNGKDNRELILLNEPFPGETPKDKIEQTAKQKKLRFQYYGKKALPIKDYPLNTK
ncbi:MAG: hypothetical protein LBU65_16935 [Planctomycetaceae bacterium]|jgi:outer membrane lipoprotein SlyB|nr:hypothetical protein [Planctomycetaceae bacterium]